MQSYPSYLLENAVAQLSKLPGIGRKSALRLALFLLKQDKEMVDDFAKALMMLKSEVKYCECCKNISDSDVCSICSDEKRDSSTICVVETIKELMLVEHTTMEGDTTAFYIARKLAAFPEVSITTIARGVAIGDELQYADELTLGKSIINRIPYKN